MTLLGARDLHKAFGARAVLEGASVAIDEGEKVGVVGHNGSGKSTLARILAGLEPPDTGTVARRSGAAVAYLAQEPVLDLERTPREIVTAGLAAWADAKARYEKASEAIAHAGSEAAVSAELAKQAAASADLERLGGWDRAHDVDAILGHLGVTDLDAKVGTLSGGGKRRVALAALLVAQPDLAILDEPSNHLDADTIAWLERYLVEAYKGAVLLVTHDRWLLDRVADRTLEVDGGKVFAYDGGYEDYLAAKAERMAMAERAEKNRQNFLRTELDWLRRQPKARTTKQKGRIQRAEAQIAAVPLAQQRAVELSAEVSRTGKSVLDLRGVSLRFGEGASAGPWLVKKLDLALSTGDRVGIVGRNGAGKTTLLRAILGELKPTEGEIVLGRNARIGYLDQTRSLLDDDATVFDVIARAIPESAGARIDPRTYLEKFLFDGTTSRKKVSALSGGERARVALARLLANECNLLLLDEPTNDLDVATLSALEEMLTSYGGSVLVVTHDRYFLDRVANGILCFEGEGRVTRYAGAYQAYAAAREREEEEARLAAAERTARERAAKEPKSASAPPKAKGLSKNEQRELDGLFTKIEEAEVRAAAVEAELADPKLYERVDPRVAEIQARLVTAKDEVAKLVARWEHLEAKRDA